MKALGMMEVYGFPAVVTCADIAAKAGANLEAGNNLSAQNVKVSDGNAQFDAGADLTLKSVEALNTGKIAGAGLDVLKKEPPLPDNPLVKAKNTVITPHVAWASREARERLIAISVDNVRSFLEGNPVNKVN